MGEGKIHIKGIDTFALLDFGATHSFNSQAFISRVGIITEVSSTGYDVTVPFDDVLFTTSVLTQSNSIPHIISCVRARKLLHKGCQGFLDSLVTVAEPSTRLVAEVEIVRNFPDVFLDDVVGIPPVREVELNFELLPGTVSISKASYHLAPTEMKEIKEQIQEML
ncbi:uncharacterized protein [Henckelia pumila]|uniref:uncharacterized protein n=1 Tax=Henckelia pumila TaxID=405737 RepID=UPI003C6DDA75